MPQQDSQQQQEQQPNPVPAATVLAAGSSHALQQQQQEEEEARALQPPQQLLLVATKVTGDRNVPVGQVTFVVDLDTRSRAGAGQLLQLPHWMHSAVEVNVPGTRPLKIKVC
jgi:hypothetical protein